MPILVQMTYVRRLLECAAGRLLAPPSFLQMLMSHTVWQKHWYSEGEDGVCPRFINNASLISLVTLQWMEAWGDPLLPHSPPVLEVQPHFCLWCHGRRHRRRCELWKCDAGAWHLEWGVLQMLWIFFTYSYMESKGRWFVEPSFFQFIVCLFMLLDQPGGYSSRVSVVPCHLVSCNLSNFLFLCEVPQDGLVTFHSSYELNSHKRLFKKKISKFLSMKTQTSNFGKVAIFNSLIF